MSLVSTWFMRKSMYFGTASMLMSARARWGGAGTYSIRTRPVVMSNCALCIGQVSI